MCDDGYFEIDWALKCERCGKKPAVDLSRAIPDPDYTALCEKCGVEVFGEDVVAEWAGTDLYLAKYPDEVEVWR